MKCIRKSILISEPSRRQTRIPDTIWCIFLKTSGQWECCVCEDIKLGLKKTNSTSLSAVAIPPRGQARNSRLFNDGAEPWEYCGQPTLDTMSQFRQGEKKRGKNIKRSSETSISPPALMSSVLSNFREWLESGQKEVDVEKVTLGTEQDNTAKI